MQKIRLVTCAAVALLAGCASQSACNRERETLIAMRYTGELLPYTCGYRGHAAPPAGYSKDAGGYPVGHAPSHPLTQPPKRQTGITRLGPVVGAYRMGAYVDPADPRVVHKAHTVYRVEQEAGWRLAGKVRPTQASDYPSEPAPTPATPPASVPEPQQTEALKALSKRVGDLEQAQRVNAAAVNANQQLLIGEINRLKATSGQPVKSTQADPSSP
jgi:hypothetical protein